jgi:hypothetical protein
MGGMMAFELAHTLAHRFAAVAPTVAKKNAFFEPFCNVKTIVLQDRPGTNVGKTQAREMRFSQVAAPLRGFDNVPAGQEQISLLSLWAQVRNAFFESVLY